MRFTKPDNQIILRLFITFGDFSGEIFPCDSGFPVSARQSLLVTISIISISIHYHVLFCGPIVSINIACMDSLSNSKVENM